MRLRMMAIALVVMMGVNVQLPSLAETVVAKKSQPTIHRVTLPNIKNWNIMLWLKTLSPTTYEFIQSLLAPPVTYTELLSNPTFDSGTAGWVLDTRSGNGNYGTVTDTGGILKIVADPTGPAYFYTDIPDQDLTGCIVEIEVVSSTPSNIPGAPAFVFEFNGTHSFNVLNAARIPYNGTVGLYQSGLDTQQPSYNRVWFIVNQGATVQVNSIHLKKPN